MADPYRLENLTPEQVNRAKSLYRSYGMTSLPMDRGAEAFNSLPEDKRRRLFEALQQAPEEGAVPEAPVGEAPERAPDVTVTRLGGLSLEDTPVPLTERMKQRGIVAREVSFSDTINPRTGEVTPGFRPPKAVSITESLIDRGYQVRDVFGEAPYGEAAKEGFRRGLVEGAATGGGVAGGIRAGVALMPYVASVAPLLAPFTPAVTGLAGFAASLFALEAAEEDLEAKRPKDPRVQPLYEGMRTFGGGLVGGPSVAYSLPTATAQSGRLGQVIGQLGDFARANPHSFFAREALISAYAGLYGGTTVAVLPPDQYPVAGPLTRLVAEMGASVLSPGKIVFDGFMAGRSGLSVSAERKAAEAIRRVVQGEGEDVNRIADEIAAALADRPIDPETGLPVKLTSAQLIDSRGLTMLERTLARNNAEFSAETKEMGERGFMVYNELLRRLRDSGDPNLVRTAARMEEAHLQKNLQMAIDQATFIAAEKAQKLGLRSVKNRAQIAGIINTELQKVIDASRVTQSELWTKAVVNAFRVNKKGKVVPVKIPGKNLTQQYLELFAGPTRPTDSALAIDYGAVTSELRGLGLDVKKAKKAYRTGAKDPAYLEFVEKKRDGVSPALAGVEIPDMQVNRLLQVMGEFRDKARTARSQGRPELAMNYTKLANAVLDDLNALDDPIYQEARAFSKAFNDVFTRTFAGELDDMDRTGKLRIPIETMVSRTVRGGADAAYMRMMEITGAARFSEKLVADAQSYNVVKETYAREAKLLKDSLVRVKPVDINDARQVSALAFTAEERARGARAVSISQFIKQNGGIADLGGELAAQDITNKSLPGLVRRVQRIGGRAIVPPEASMDAVRQRLFEAGYFTNKTDYNQISDSEIIDALKRDLFQEKVWTVRVRDKLSGVLGEREALDDWASQGITPDMDVEDIATQLFRLDEAAKKQGLPTTVPSSLFEKVAGEFRPAGGIAPSEIVNTVLGAQQRMLRSLAAETVETRKMGDSYVRLINPSKFQSFVERNGDLIDELGMKDELSSALRAQQALEDVLDPGSKANYTLRGQKLFADLLDRENPFDPVFSALAGDAPVRDVKELLLTIYKSPLTGAEKAQAKDGLADMLFEYAYQKAGGAENFDPKKYERALFGPLQESDRRVFPSLISLMRQEGIISPEQAKNQRRILDAYLRIQKTMSPGALAGQEDLPTAAMSTIEELALSQVMARVAGQVNPGGPGSLSVAQRLIRRGEMLFKRVPTQKQFAMLREASKDPALMEQLLRRDLTMQEKRGLAFRLASFLFSPTVAPTAAQRYVNAPTDEQLIEEREEDRLRRAGSAARELRKLDRSEPTRSAPRPISPAPPARGMPGMTPPAGGAPPAGGGGGAPPTSQSRMMLQQLFPNDAIMGAAAIQAGTPPMPG